MRFGFALHCSSARMLPQLRSAYLRSPPWLRMDRLPNCSVGGDHQWSCHRHVFQSTATRAQSKSRNRCIHDNGVKQKRSHRSRSPCLPIVPLPQLRPWQAKRLPGVLSPVSTAQQINHCSPEQKSLLLPPTLLLLQLDIKIPLNSGG